MSQTEEYWIERMRRAQEKQATQSITELQKELNSYYSKAMRRLIKQFEATYEKLLRQTAEGITPSVADLYKLDTYYKLQGALRLELQRLGDKQEVLFSKKFEEAYERVWKSISFPSQSAFTQPSLENARQLINSVWCADGKNWSTRVWGNIDKLQDSLNDALVDCVITGKKTTELKHMLMEEFGVGYNRADTIARTEVAHIQTQAARERYKDYGIQKVKIVADKSSRTCPQCAEMDGKEFSIDVAVPVPVHPRCRCCIVPVVDLTSQKEDSRLQDKPKEKPRRTRAMSAHSYSKTIPVEPPDIVQRAIDKVKELQKSGEPLHFYKRTKRHQNHAEELTGLTGDAAWQKYEEMADAFLKKDIDGKDMEGFMSSMDWLFKFEHSSGRIGILSDKGTISTLFVPDKQSPEEYWKEQINEYGK